MEKSIIISFSSLPSLSSLKDMILPTLSGRQKIILTVIAIALAFLAVCYAIGRRCFDRSAKIIDLPPTILASASGERKCVLLFQKINYMNYDSKVLPLIQKQYPDTSIRILASNSQLSDDDNEFLADSPNLFIISQGINACVMSVDGPFFKCSVLNRWFATHPVGKAQMFYIDPTTHYVVSDVNNAPALSNYPYTPFNENQLAKSHNPEIEIKRYLFLHS